jgi:hypothetical protein
MLEDIGSAGTHASNRVERIGRGLAASDSVAMLREAPRNMVVSLNPGRPGATWRWELARDPFLELKLDRVEYRYGSHV